MRKMMKAIALVTLCALVVVVPFAWANWIQDGVVICAATGDQWYPTIVSDGADGAIVTWQDRRNGVNYDVFAQRVNASGAIQWTANGVALCAAINSQWYPTVVPDGAGGAIVTWWDYRSGSFSDVYVQRVNASGVPQWTTDGVALCTAAGQQRYQTIVSDAAGGAIVTWQDSRGAYSHIYAQRVNASGTPQWTANGMAICMATGNQQYPTITSDGVGGAIVTWQDGRSGNYEIYGQRVNASGVVQWAPDGVDFCTATGVKQYPTIVSDGAGGAIVTWHDSRNGSSWEIYAQRVDSSGAAQWTANGVALCTATEDQKWPIIASDGAGGAIVTWLDYRSGSDWDIYAQRVDATGAVQWTTNGATVCAAMGAQEDPAIISDGAGGAIVTWHDLRGGIGDIYAQRMNASGTPQWTTDGVALCTAALAQQNPQITSDGWGGAIVTWDDPRKGATFSDIYALRVDANGFAVLTGTDAADVPMELHQNFPNPFNPVTMVTYSVPEKCNVTVEIYDVSGKRIECLVDKQQEKGSYAVEWNARNARGNSVSSGVYFCRLTAGHRTITKKMILLK
jgi:hypothetical protein